MRPDVLARVFDPFFTTKPTGQGTGLGLSMVYGFARQSGGRVEIESEPDRGTLVTLFLPRYRGVAHVEDQEVHHPVTHDPRRETILVVEDEPVVRGLIVEALHDLGYVPLEAADAASGLIVLQSDKPVDLLVTDVGLPGGMNGRQLADAARQTRPALKVLFMTGYAENVVIGNEPLEYGMQMVTKPFLVEALASRIRQMMES
jgi:CheY-like chemotaxis protein